MALHDGPSPSLGVEVVGLAPFAVLATAALVCERPGCWLAAGYVGHGLWDLVHPGVRSTRPCLPQNRRQVPQAVLQRGLVSGGLQFGFELGTGVRTYVPSAAPYVVAVALLLLAPSPLVALATGAGFGSGRTITALVRRWSGMSIDEWGSHLLDRMAVTTVGLSSAILATLAVMLLT